MKLLIENWQEYLEEEEILMEKCWPGYEKKGMKKMFGKMYPNCVKKKKSKKKNEEVEISETQTLEDPMVHDYRKRVWQARSLLGDDFSTENIEKAIAEVFPELDQNHREYKVVFDDLSDMAKQQIDYDAEQERMNTIVPPADIGDEDMPL